MTDEEDEVLATTDRRFPGKMVSLQKPRSYEIPGGPKARNLGPRDDVLIMAEFERGGPHDRAR